MSNSVNPLVSTAIIAVVVILVGFGLYKAFMPPQYPTDTHHGQPFGDHQPPAIAHYGQPTPAPATPAGRS